jgi:hypothetical protein
VVALALEKAKHGYPSDGIVIDNEGSGGVAEQRRHLSGSKA